MTLTGSRRSPAPTLRPAFLVLLALAALAVGACGGEDDPAPVAADAADAPPISPLARIALVDAFEHSDPLYVAGDSDRILSRQIYDPLVSRVDPPLGVSGARRGPARPLGPDDSGDWRFEFRAGARFHDGSPINFEAVQANVQRWLTSGVLGELLPEFIAVDAPLPGQVRFQLTEPVPNLPAILSDPRLGLVAPATIATAGGSEITGGEGGSGAYEPGYLGRRRAVLVAAANWWGRGAGLGPGVRELQLLAVESERRRTELLADGLTQVSQGLGEKSLAELRREPLLVSPPENPNGIAASAAVRGLRSSEPVQPLSELWLTSLR
jgi:peptide/nickel transport system substrate-binding protein